MTTWEERLAAALDDLELEAEGLHLAARDAEVAELALGAYTTVDLTSRLHASTGEHVHLATGAGPVDGVVAGAGRDWLLLRHPRGESVVLLRSAVRVRGLSPRSAVEQARPVLARRGLGSVLRQLASERDEVRLTSDDGSSVQGRLGRVGADFVEVLTASGAVDAVALAHLVVLRRLG